MGAAMDDHVGADERPVEDMSYTEASAELDAIVGFFEGREVDVDQLVARLVRATAIIEELDKRLRRTRVQVEQLVPRLSAVLEDAADEPALEPHGAREGDGVVVARNAEVSRSRTSGRVREDADDDEPGLF
jgi:exonuclease VII small subunit